MTPVAFENSNREKPLAFEAKVYKNKIPINLRVLLRVFIDERTSGCAMCIVWGYSRNVFRIYTESRCYVGLETQKLGL